jgi:hypothetical protein
MLRPPQNSQNSIHSLWFCEEVDQLKIGNHGSGGCDVVVEVLLSHEN